jgi:hypothetical protein
MPRGVLEERQAYLGTAMMDFTPGEKIAAVSEQGKGLEFWPLVMIDGIQDQKKLS